MLVSARLLKTDIISFSINFSINPVLGRVQIDYKTKQSGGNRSEPVHVHSDKRGVIIVFANTGTSHLRMFAFIGSNYNHVLLVLNLSGSDTSYYKTFDYVSHLLVMSLLVCLCSTVIREVKTFISTHETKLKQVIFVDPEYFIKT